MEIIRNKFNGLFYPDETRELRDMIDEYMGKVELKKQDGKLKALITPHAGYVYSAPVAAYSYHELKRSGVNKVILLGPSHYDYFKGIACSSSKYWEDPFLKEDIELLSCKNGDVLVRNDKPFKEEHSVEVQMPFLVSVVKDLKLMVLITGEVEDHVRAAYELNREMDEHTVLVISSDLSHYHDYETAGKMDKKTIDQIISLEGNVNSEQACGFNGINILIELARVNGWVPRLLNYRNSGDTAGGKSQVVGYCAIGFYSK